MQYTIEEFHELTFTGYDRTFSVKDGQNFEEIPKFWDEVHRSGKFQYLLKEMDEWGPLALSYGYESSSGEFHYMIGVRKEATIPNTKTVSFGPTMFAKFEATGPLPNSMQQVIQDVHQTFFEEEGFYRAEGPEIELYGPGDPSKEDYKSYYLVPVKRNHE